MITAARMKKAIQTRQRLITLLQEYYIDYIEQGYFIVKIPTMQGLECLRIMLNGWIRIYGLEYSGLMEYSPEYTARMLHRKFGGGLQTGKAEQPDCMINCTVDGLTRMLNPEYFESFKKLCKRAKLRVPEQEAPENDYEYIVRLSLRHGKRDMDK